MGNNLSSKEQSVSSTWKTLLKRKGIKTTDYALQSMLLWAKSQDFETGASTAFSVSAWKEVRERLWDVVSKGNKAAADLSTTRRVLYKNGEQSRVIRESRRWKENQREKLKLMGNSRKGKLSLRMCPSLKQSPLELLLCKFLRDLLLWEMNNKLINASWYLSPKDYVKPVYPSPAEHLAELSAKSKYATPSQ